MPAWAGIFRSFPEFFAESEAIHFRHGHVHDDHIWPAAAHHVEGLKTVGGSFNGETLLRQKLVQQFQLVWFIVHCQYFAMHKILVL